MKSISNGVNPQSPDYLNFNNGRQPLVDAAFLAHGLLRARTQLWDKLDKTTQERVIKELKSSRVIKPSETNWLFFSAMVEAALKEFTGEGKSYSYLCKMAERYKSAGDAQADTIISNRIAPKYSPAMQAKVRASIANNYFIDWSL